MYKAQENGEILQSVQNEVDLCKKAKEALDGDMKKRNTDVQNKQAEISDLKNQVVSTR